MQGRWDGRRTLSELVLKSPNRASELFECVFSDDPIVRMRASDAFEKVSQERPDLLSAVKDRLLTNVPTIEQPSVQWHLAQLLPRLTLASSERRQAIGIPRRNLSHYDDWIVVNLTPEALAAFARHHKSVRDWLIRTLPRFEKDRRKSVSSRARKLAEEFSGQ